MAVVWRTECFERVFQNRRWDMVASAMTGNYFPLESTSNIEPDSFRYHIGAKRAPLQISHMPA
jgi:hypothetical protein